MHTYFRTKFTNDLTVMMYLCSVVGYLHFLKKFLDLAWGSEPDSFRSRVVKPRLFITVPSLEKFLFRVEQQCCQFIYFFTFFTFCHSILCRVQIRNRIRNSFWFRSGKKFRFLRFRFRFHNTASKVASGIKAFRIHITASCQKTVFCRVPTVPT